MLVGKGEVGQGRVGWFTVHVHLGLSSRPELISVEEGGCRGSRQREVGRQGGREGASQRAGGSGLGGWPPVQMISPDLCVWLCVFLRVGGGGRGGREWGSACKRKMGWVCVLGRERFNRKLKCHKGSFQPMAGRVHSNGRRHHRSRPQPHAPV